MGAWTPSTRRQFTNLGIIRNSGGGGKYGGHLEVWDFMQPILPTYPCDSSGPKNPTPRDFSPLRAAKQESMLTWRSWPTAIRYKGLIEQMPEICNSNACIINIRTKIKVALSGELFMAPFFFTLQLGGRHSMMMVHTCWRIKEMKNHCSPTLQAKWRSTYQKLVYWVPAFRHLWQTITSPEAVEVVVWL